MRPQGSCAALHFPRPPSCPGSDEVPQQITNSYHSENAYWWKGSFTGQRQTSTKEALESISLHQLQGLRFHLMTINTSYLTSHIKYFQVRPLNQIWESRYDSFRVNEIWEITQPNIIMTSRRPITFFNESVTESSKWHDLENPYDLLCFLRKFYGEPHG